MLPSHETWWHALLGGVCIGLGSLLAAGASGRIPGISGLCSRLLTFRAGDTAWRAVFLVGLLAGAGIAFALIPPAAAFDSLRSLPVLAAAGLLVGFGTRIGGGCTSGHGVCGLGLGSKSALVATLVFMGTAVATVWLVHHTGLGRLLG